MPICSLSPSLSSQGPLDPLPLHVGAVLAAQVLELHEAVVADDQLGVVPGDARAVQPHEGLLGAADEALAGIQAEHLAGGVLAGEDDEVGRGDGRNLHGHRTQEGLRRVLVVILEVADAHRSGASPRSLSERHPDIPTPVALNQRAG